MSQTKGFKRIYHLGHKCPFKQCTVFHAGLEAFQVHKGIQAQDPPPHVFSTCGFRPIAGPCMDPSLIKYA